MELNLSIIIPVYNRPQEIKELLESLTLQTYAQFEVLVVEDGSDEKVDKICQSYSKKLNLIYLEKENSGAGASRNYGMERATGNYFVILDSDCVLPPDYLKEVINGLTKRFTDGFGGPDAAHQNFTALQKGINYAMTSVLTTGGIRGNKHLKKFQPRSFNMGLSKTAFESTKGFGNINYGEDIDLTIRLWSHGFETQFIEKAFVYHKRRVTWEKFFKQTFNFGAARPILNKRFPQTAKITYWFPTGFVIGTGIGLILALFKFNLALYFIAGYLLLILIHAAVKSNSIKVGILALIATFVMFYGYGLGFIRTWLNLNLWKKTEKNSFVKMFNN